MALKGSTAVVTGGSRGIGLAIVQAFLRDGANVVFTGTKAATTASVQKDLDAGESTGRVLGVKADVRSFDEIDAAIGTAVSTFGGLDILINNAGVGVFAAVADMDVAEWQRVIDTNVTGVFYACRAALPHMRRRGGGWIVNVSSLASKNPFPNAAAYCASKAALNAFSEVLMQEVRYDGIRVAHVLPGSVNTGFGGLSNTKSEWALMPDDVAEVVTDLIAHPVRSLPSRVEIRPAKPPQKG